MKQFADRRKRFMEKMGKGVAIITSAMPFESMGGFEYRYRQDADFYYLTGFEEPDAICVLCPAHEEHNFVMFVRPRDPKLELWTGKRAGVEGACQIFGADQAYPIDQFEEKISIYLENTDQLYYALGQNERLDQTIISQLNRLRRRFSPKRVPFVIVEPSVLLAPMRLIKDEYEISALRKAVAATAKAFRDAMCISHGGIYEYEIEAVLLQGFRQAGGIAAFPPVVAAGENATILHYGNNCRRIRNNDLVLVDAGASLDYYTADVSRTWPVNGCFNACQRDLYQLVLQAQLAAIDQVQPGRPCSAPHETAVEELTKGMVALGLLKGSVSDLIDQKAYRRFFMHHTSHWLGIDLHDPGDYFVDGEIRCLEPGMVLTVEPGIYVPPESEGVDPCFWGIGIRIEDDVLVTEQGHEVLSRDIPKEIAALEASIGQAPPGRAKTGA